MYLVIRGEIRKLTKDKLMRKRLSDPPPFHGSGTKVKGSKMIRYRRSLNCKPYYQKIGCLDTNQILSGFKGNLKLLSSGGSIVARPKLKGIDGKTPPGVEFAA